MQQPPANKADGDEHIHPPSETDKEYDEAEKSTHPAENEPEVTLDAWGKGGR